MGSPQKYPSGLAENKFREKLAKLIRRSQALGVNPVDLIIISKNSALTKVSSLRKVVIFIAVISFLVTIPWLFMEFKDCYLNIPSFWGKIFRPPQSCDFCRGVTEVKRISNVRPDDFEREYAYNSVPVVVTDATANWTALQVFDFWYFKNVYDKAHRSHQKLNCQFFPYQSGFESLEEALSISEDRVNYVKGTKPWYFGWSNCNPNVARELRQHYGRPYFLPTTSENDDTDWMFMGGSGLGAHMHVDNVRLPSWQAQIKGSKEWTLAPPPECYFECSFMEVEVKTGDIIVLNTNQWFHKTRVLPGELSITIGAEYD